MYVTQRNTCIIIINIHTIKEWPCAFVDIYQLYVLPTLDGTGRHWSALVGNNHHLDELTTSQIIQAIDIVYTG